MRRNTISEGVAAPLPGNRLSALPTNTQLDTAPTHKNIRTLEHEYTRTLVTLEHQNTEGPVHSGAPLILHGGALQLSTRALAQLGTRENTKAPEHRSRPTCLTWWGIVEPCWADLPARSLYYPRPPHNTPHYHTTTQHTTLHLVF